jgi:hypothetical protein
MASLNQTQLVAALRRVYLEVDNLTETLVPYERQLKKLGFHSLKEMSTEDKLAAANFIKRIAEEAQG